LNVGEVLLVLELSELEELGPFCFKKRDIVFLPLPEIACPNLLDDEYRLKEMEEGNHENNQHKT
jgi:hypothetical protein